MTMLDHAAKVTCAAGGIKERSIVGVDVDLRDLGVEF